MTCVEIGKALESVQKILEAIAQDPEWIAIANDGRSHPELLSDMGDALHYLSEMISKLEDSL